MMQQGTGAQADIAAMAQDDPGDDAAPSAQPRPGFNRSSLVRSALIVTRATYVTYIAGLVVSTLTARALGPHDYGRYSYVVWLSGLVVMGCTNGLTISGIKFVAERLGRGDGHGAAHVYQLLRRYFLYAAAATTVATLVALPFMQPHGWRGGFVFLAAVVLVSGLAKSLYLLHSSVAKGWGNFSIESNSTNLAGLLGVAATGVLVLLRAPLDAFLLLFAVLGIVHLLLARTFLRGTAIHPEPGTVDAETMRRLRIHLAWTIAQVLLATASNRTVETFLLNRTTGAEAVGYFIIAATLARSGAELLSSGLTAVLLPAMSHSYGQGGHARVNRLLSNAVRYFAFFGVLLAGVGALASDLVVHLMYGAKYAPVADVLKAMAIVAGLTLPEGAFNAVLIAVDQQRLRVMLTGVAVLLSACLALVLVPRFGLAGAVAGHVAARTIMFATMLLLSTFNLKMRLPWRALGRQAACAAIATLAAFALLAIHPGPWMAMAAAAVFAAAFCACSIPLGVWEREDFAMLEPLSRRFPRLGALLARVLPH